jgi:hypothetical protein
MINLLGKKGQNPITSEQDDDVIDHFIGISMLLKIFELVAQNLSLEDWFYEADVQMILRQTNEDDIRRLLDTVYEYWNHDQVQVPAGELSSTSEIDILPIMPEYNALDKSRYAIKMAEGGTNATPNLKKRILQAKLEGDDLDYGMLSAHSEFMHTEPVVYITEVIANAQEAEAKWASEGFENFTPEEGFIAEFVRIRTINATDQIDYITYNKYTGRYSGLTLEQDSSFLINVVFPLELFLKYPDHAVGVRIRKEEWQLEYQMMKPYKALFNVKYSRERFLYGQKSFLGPKYYLFDTEDLIKKVVEYRPLNKAGNLRGMTQTDIIPDLFGSLNFVGPKENQTTFTEEP